MVNSLSFIVKKGLILLSKYTKSASSPSEIVDSLHKYKNLQKANSGRLLAHCILSTSKRWFIHISNATTVLT